MKKIVLMVLGLLVFSVFLVGCSSETVEVVDEEGNIVGEAFRLATGKYRLVKKQIECDTFEALHIGIDITEPPTASFHQVCIQQGYQTCSGLSLVAGIKYNDGTSSLFNLPLPCDLSLPDQRSPFDLVDENILGDHTPLETTLKISCCRIK